MTESEFPKPVDDIVATLTEIYRHQGESDLVELLNSASARLEQIDFDNWNGGTYKYDLKLDIPVRTFAIVEPRLQAVEQSISEKLEMICRNLPNHNLNSVTITPLTIKSTIVGSKSAPVDSAVIHLWKEGYFRLFISHVSAHKASVAQLKFQLNRFGISAFVAHEDITPSAEWQEEIELALHSMHALAALLTPDFHASNWTDQEIGFALGRGVPVLPVRLGADPYGFIGKWQGIPASLDKPDLHAATLAKILLNHSTTRHLMRKAYVSALAMANSYSNAIFISKQIATVNDFTTDEKNSLMRACKENDQVFNAIGVVSRICDSIGLPIPKKAPAVDDNVPF